MTQLTGNSQQTLRISGFRFIPFYLAILRAAQFHGVTRFTRVAYSNLGGFMVGEINVRFALFLGAYHHELHKSKRHAGKGETLSKLSATVHLLFI